MTHDKATPRPWKCKLIEEDDDLASIYHNGPLAYLKEGPGLEVSTQNANAALIVSAVNSHDAAVELARGIVNRWHGKPSNLDRKEPPEIEQAREVLRLTEASE